MRPQTRGEYCVWRINWICHKVISSFHITWYVLSILFLLSDSCLYQTTLKLFHYTIRIKYFVQNRIECWRIQPAFKYYFTLKKLWNLKFNIFIMILYRVIATYIDVIILIRVNKCLCWWWQGSWSLLMQG